MRRVWLIIGIILLVAGVLFEERHRAGTMKHLHPAALANPAPALFVFQENNFHDYVDLWGDPRPKTDDPDSNDSNLAVENPAKPGTVDKFQNRAGDKTDPVLTVEDRAVAYSLLDLGGLKLRVNLKPAYATPEAFLPTRIDPGISGSFSF